MKYYIVKNQTDTLFKMKESDYRIKSGEYTIITRLNLKIYKIDSLEYHHKFKVQCGVNNIKYMIFKDFSVLELNGEAL